MDRIRKDQVIRFPGILKIASSIEINKMQTSGRNDSMIHQLKIGSRIPDNASGKFNHRDVRFWIKAYRICSSSAAEPNVQNSSLLTRAVKNHRKIPLHLLNGNQFRRTSRDVHSVDGER